MFQKRKKLLTFTKKVNKVNFILFVKHIYLFFNSLSLPLSTIVPCVKAHTSKLSFLSGLCFVFLFFSSPLFSQEQTINTTHPKIGLVLSGGGAKGLAHIGVLKVIDSLGIKLDYIGGTSMGAIVGGLYASGYSGKQLDSIFKSLDIDALIQDNVPRKSKNYFEKRNDDTYILTLPFKKFKIITPTGLSKGLYNYNVLSQLTYHVRHIRDFSCLTIPFFCMATDIETGEEIILDKGPLALSLMASSAIPSLYKPINVDGKLLVDGGVRNNFPVENLKQKGIDIVIGVDVQDPLRNREEIEGVTSVFLQISNFNTLEKMDEKLKLTDIYIKPEIKGYTVLSFDNGSTIIKNGEIAALNELEKLNNFSNTKLIKPNYFIKNDSVYIRELSLNDLDNYTRAYVLGKMRIKLPTTISFHDFNASIQNLNATQNFSSIQYSFENNYLKLNLVENPVKSLLKLSVHYDDIYKSAALLNITFKKIFSKNDQLSIDGIIGDNPRYDINYLVDNGFYFSFGINSFLNNFNKNINVSLYNKEFFKNIELSNINLDYHQFVNQAYVQTLLFRKATLGIGAEIQHLVMSSNNFIENKMIENSTYANLYGYLNFDTFNNKHFPSKGWYFKGNFKNYLISTNYNNTFEKFQIAKADVGLALSITNNFSFLLQSEGGFKIGYSTHDYFDFFLGGYGYRETNNFRPFYGYPFLYLKGNSYVKGASVLDYKFYKKHHLNFTYNGSIVDNQIFNATKTWFTKPSYNGFALGYGYESFLGPVEIKYSWSPELHQNYVWFNIGFIF